MFTSIERRWRWYYRCTRILMYCFCIENAYTHSGLIANPTEQCNIIWQLHWHTFCRNQELRGRIKKWGWKLKDNERMFFLIYVKKNNRWDGACVYNAWLKGKKCYLCIVFFIVLDLRLTKVGVKRYPFFYILTSSGGTPLGLLFSNNFFWWDC